MADGRLIFDTKIDTSGLIKGLSSVTSSVNTGINMVKTALLGYTGKKFFEVFIGSNAEFEATHTAFEVLTGDVGTAKKLIQELTDFAAKTPFEMPHVTQSAQLLLSYGVAVDDVMERMQQLGDISQGNADKMQRVSLAYGQMLAKQKVTGEELRQMTEAGVPLLQELANVLGVSTAELSKMIEKGEVGIPTLNKALENMTGEGGKFFGMMEKQSQTALGLFATLKDNLSIFARDIGGSAFEAVKSALKDITDGMKEMSDSGQLKALAQNLGNALGGMVKNVISLVKVLIDMRGVIIAVTSAFVGFKIAIAVGAVINATINSVRVLIAVTELYANGAKLATVAQLNMSVMSKVLGTVLSLFSGKVQFAAIKTQLWALVTQNAIPVIGTVVAVLGAVVGGIAMYNSFTSTAITDTEGMTDSLRDEVKELDELRNKYAEITDSGIQDTDSRDELVKIQKKLIDQYGDEAKALDLVNGRYEDNIRKIDQLSLKKRDALEAELKAKKIVAEEQAAKGIHADNAPNLNPVVSFGATPIEKALEKSGLNKKYIPDKESGVNALILGKSAQEIVTILTEWRDAFSALGSDGAEALKYVNEAIKFYEGNANNATNSTKEWLKTLGENKVIHDQAAAIIKNQEGFDAYIESIKNSTDYTDEMKEAIISAAVEALPKFSGALQKTGEDAENTFPDMTESIELLKKKFEILKTAQDEQAKSGNISVETLKNIAKEYPALSDSVNKYILGLIDEETMIASLSKAYEKDEASHRKASAAKLENNEQLYTKALKGNNDLVPLLAAAYGADYKNFKSFADAKAKTTEFLVKAIGVTWNKLYATQEAALASIADEHPSIKYGAHWGYMDGKTKEFLENQYTAANEIKSASNAIAEALEVAIDIPDFTAPTSSSKSSKSDKDDTERKNEEARKELVKNYLDNIAEMEREDERYNNRKKELGELSLNDEQYILQERAKRYREHVEAIMQMDIFTEEEKLKIKKEYLEKAEDLELAAWKIQQQRKKDAANERTDDSFAYVDEASYFNEWANGDDPMKARQRVRDALQEDVAAGIKTQDEADAKLAEFDRILYENRLANSEQWISDMKEFGELSYDEEVAAYQRIREYTQEYYDLGIIDRKTYFEEMNRLDRKFYALEREEMERQIKEEYKARQDALDAKEEAIRKSYEAENALERSRDREKDLAELKELEALYANSVTVEGQNKLKDIRRQIEAIEKEKKQEQRELEYKKKLEAIEKERTELVEQEKKAIEAMVKELSKNGKYMQEIAANITELMKRAGNFVDDLLSELTSAHEAIHSRANNSFNVTQNNKNIINDPTAADAVIRMPVPRFFV